MRQITLCAHSRRNRDDDDNDNNNNNATADHLRRGDAYELYSPVGFIVAFPSGERVHDIFVHGRTRDERR